MGDREKVSVASLQPCIRSGSLTKQGGSIKTWKRRWMVLHGTTLYYFKGKNDNDLTGDEQHANIIEPLVANQRSPYSTRNLGLVQLEKNSVIKGEPGKSGKKKFAWSISTTKRTYYIYADTKQEQQEWMQALQTQVKSLSAPEEAHKDTVVSSNSTSTPSAAAAATTTPTTNDKSTTPSIAANSSTAHSQRDKLLAVKDCVSFLAHPDSKVLEFWQIWYESIPTPEEIDENAADDGIDFFVAMSADGQKLTWRTCGPQNLFIQKMVDFFWNVGAPESEIDRLNDVGSRINPTRIGSWIDMSEKMGMDGGWYFPEQVTLSLCLEAADDGSPTQTLATWAADNGIASAMSVGRDMGAAPPRQTEFRVEVPGSAEDQARIAMSSVSAFGFPELPAYASNGLSASKAGIQMSIITSADSFVRLGILQPKPTVEEVATLLGAMSDANPDALRKLEKSIAVQSPAFVEYQYLQTGFGYGVYREGFDVVFHYTIE